MIYISYVRVSTQQQGRSGLGLEAQQLMVTPYQPVRSYTEIESGKHSQRPELMKALADCKRSKATLVIAKLDRLSRNVYFLSGLMESKVDFICCDMPNANRLTLHILAAVAEDEARMISQRTKEALAAYKARGGVLGAARAGAYKFKGGHNAVAVERASVRNSELARDAYADLRPVLLELRATGLSLKVLAQKLSTDGHKTRRGKTWNAVQVRRVLEMAA